METQQNDISSYEEINVSEILRSLWSSKILIIIVTTLFAIGSVAFALMTPDKYSSSALLQVQYSKESSSGSIFSQLGGIASLAGVSLSSQSSNKSYYAIETIKSRDFLKHLNSFEGVAENLIAAKGYNASENETIFDENIFDAEKKLWIRGPTKERKTIPTYLEVHESYIKQINVSIDKKSGYISISFEHFSPQFAYSFINLIISELNSVSKKKDMEESEKSLEYLLNQSKSNDVANVRNSISFLINNQLEKLMLANVREDYLVSVVDAPYVPEINSYPNRPLIAIFGTIFGFLISIMYIFIIFYLEKRKR